MKRGALPLIAVFAIGLVVTAWYVFGTRYLAYPDAVRSYQLYGMMRTESYWSVYHYANVIDRSYALQVSCLFTTFIPAKISMIIPVSPEIFYKIYILIMLSLLPVAVYALARNFTNIANSFIAALFLIGWVNFLQGASTARATIALGFLALALLFAFRNNSGKYLRYGIIICAGALVPVAHYATAMIAIMLLAGVIVLSLIIKKATWNFKRPMIVLFSAILLITLVWCFAISRNPLTVMKMVISDALSNAPMTAQVIQSPTVSGGSSDTPSPEIVYVPGKINQALFGHNSYGGGSVVYYALLAIGWLTLMLIAYGLYRAFKERRYPAELRVMGLLSVTGCIIVISVPFLSSAYGIERIYFQGLLVLGEFFAYGVSKLAEKLNARAFAIGLPLVLVYGILMKSYCLINSVMR